MERTVAGAGVDRDGTLVDELGLRALVVADSVADVATVLVVVVVVVAAGDVVGAVVRVIGGCVGSTAVLVVGLAVMRPAVTVTEVEAPCSPRG